MKMVDDDGLYTIISFLLFVTVHCRQRRVDQRRHINPSTSANTYWQIEKGEDSKTGQIKLH